MHGIRTRLLLGACLAVCLTSAAPARAHEDTSEMSRADLLLLQDTVPGSGHCMSASVKSCPETRHSVRPSAS